MSTSQWYALRSKAHKEDVLSKQLPLVGLESFLPKIKVNPVNPRAAKLRPLFPNYMFVKANLQELGSTFFESLPFSQGLVQMGGQPASISETIIREIKKMVASLNEAGGIEMNKLKSGAAVYIVQGPFSGYEGIFDMKLSGTDRVLILLKVANNKKIRAELPIAAVHSKNVPSDKMK